MRGVAPDSPTASVKVVGDLTQYCSVKKIAKPETLVETLHVRSLQGLTKVVLGSDPCDMSELTKQITSLSCRKEIFPATFIWVF